MEAKLIDGQSLTLEEAFKKFTPLIGHISKKLLKTALKYGLEFDDLVSYGSEGLIKAFKRFDPSRGFKFVTFAFPLIQGEIQSRVRDYGGTVRFTRNEKSLARKIYKGELENLSVSEISERTGHNERDVLGALAILNGSSVSIDKRIGDGEEKDITMGDRIGVNEDFSSVEVEDFISILPERLESVIRLSLQDKTQQEIADQIGCSQVHVSRSMKKIGEYYQKYLRGEINGMAKLEMTVDEFLKLKYIDKLPITKIAKLKGVADPTIHYWINKHKESIEKAQGTQIQPITAEKKQHECKCTKEDKTAEYERLIGELKLQIDVSKSDCKERIDWIVKEYEDKLADKQLDYESVKRDYLQAREENNRLTNQICQDDTVIENQKYQLGQYAKEIAELQEENEKLKYFALKYLAV